MKKVTYYLVIAMIAICSISKANFAQTKVQKQFDYDSSVVKTYQVRPNQDVVVMINNVRKYDVLSIEPDTTNSINSKNTVIKLKAWEVVYTTDASTTRSTSAIQGINTLADSNISFNKGILVINSSGANKRSVIHLDIPSGIRTKIYVNGVQYHDGSLSTPVMVQNARLNSPNANSANISGVNDREGYSPEASIMSAILPSVTFSSNSELSKVIRRIDSNTLSNLALKKLSPPLMQDKGQTWALLNVEVNEMGQVTGTSYAAGDTRLSDLCAPTFKQFTFQPFVVDGKAIKVASFVPITSVNGKITLFGQIKQ